MTSSTELALTLVLQAAQPASLMRTLQKSYKTAVDGPPSTVEPKPDRVCTVPTLEFWVIDIYKLFRTQFPLPFQFAKVDIYCKENRLS